MTIEQLLDTPDTLRVEREFVYRAYNIADSIDIKLLKAEVKDGLISATSSELYYQLSSDTFLYILSYGTIVFCNETAEDRSIWLKIVDTHCKHKKVVYHEDELRVTYAPSHTMESLFSVVRISRFDHEVNKIIMLNLAQSVTLDKYSQDTQWILSDIIRYTEDMHTKGRVGLSQKETMQFIGKVLLTKNNIAENLYILDTPDKAWEEEYIDRLHKALVHHFELAARHRAIENTIKIIEDNLEIFATYNNHRESSRLEWIIIILIVIEVIDTLAGKFL